GAIQFVGGSPVLIDCSLVQNRAAPGGIHSTGGATPALTGCDFIGNWTTDPAFNGGGAYLGAAGGHTTLTDCRFIGNRTARICGAAWFTGSSATIDRCQFIDNYGFDAGCLGFANGSVGAVSNSLFVGNTADIFSAALEVWNGLGAASNVMLANCTFADNNAA